MDQVRASGMTPVLVTGYIAGRVILKVEIVGPIEIDQPIGIVHEIPRR